MSTHSGGRGQIIPTSRQIFGFEKQVSQERDLLHKINSLSISVYTVWTINVVPAEIVRRPHGIFWLNHWQIQTQFSKKNEKKNCFENFVWISRDPPGQFPPGKHCWFTRYTSIYKEFAWSQTSKIISAPLLVHKSYPMASFKSNFVQSIVCQLSRVPEREQAKPWSCLDFPNP